MFLTKRDGYTGEYWLKVVFVWTKCSKVYTQSTKGQSFLVLLEQAKLVSGLLKGNQIKLV